VFAVLIGEDVQYMCIYIAFYNNQICLFTWLYVYLCSIFIKIKYAWLLNYMCIYALNDTVWMYYVAFHYNEILCLVT